MGVKGITLSSKEDYVIAMLVVKEKEQYWLQLKKVLAKEPMLFNIEPNQGAVKV